MQEVIYLPASTSPNWKGPIVFVLPAALVIIWITAEDNVSRTIFLVFVVAFAVLALLTTRFYQSRFSHGLRLDAEGIHYLPFAERYGVEMVPWNEIERIDMFRSSSGNTATGAPWLRIFIRQGEFLHKLNSPPSERIFGGNINILLSFDTEAQEVVKTVKAFHQKTIHTCL